MTRPPFRTTRRTSRRRASRLLLAAAISLLPILATERPAQGAGEALGRDCGTAADKWRWHSLFADYLPPFRGGIPAVETEISPASCLNCLLWSPDTLAADTYSRTDRESMSLGRAQCLRALGMESEALRAFWRIASEDPDKETRAVCTDAILGILYDYGSLDRVVGLYHSLPAAAQERLSPDGLYRVAQSCYRTHRNREAEALLLKIPRDSQLFPYALYEQAQAAFRQGDTPQALTFLQAIVELPSDPELPEVLRETAQLTRARLLFQQGSYEKAIEGFRQLAGSRLYLPDAVMGAGWCYQALGQPSRAISTFGTMAQVAGADAGSWARARLEMAHLYSREGLQEQALAIFQEVQQHLEGLISRYREADRDPELLADLASEMLTPSAPAGTKRTRESRTIGDRRPEVEMRLYLEKESYTSRPFKELLALGLDLQHIEARVEGPQSATQTPSETEGALYRYPPLSPPLPVLDPEMVGLLDASLMLLDAEYRLDQTQALLDQAPFDGKAEVGRARTGFYRTLYCDVFAPTRTGLTPLELLGRMQSAVRNLPYPLEVRRQILGKVLSLRENLEEGEKTLQRWEAGLERRSSPDEAPSRLLLLQRWLSLVRNLVQLGSWADQPLVVSLLQTLAPSDPMETAATGKRVMRERLAARVGEVRQRLQDLVGEQIHRTNERRTRDFEAILVRGQLYQAEALLHQQEELLGAMQESPEE